MSHRPERTNLPEPPELPTLPEPEATQGPASRSGGPPVGPAPALPASVAPYLGATGLAGVAMAALVLATTLPVAGVLEVGLTFLAVAMVVRRLEDVGDGAAPGPVEWAADMVQRFDERFGVQFYGIATATAFVRREVRSLADPAVTLSEVLSNPIGSLIRWFVTELIESIMNAVWSALWWMDLLALAQGGRPLVAGAVLASAWAVWKVLDHGAGAPPGARPEEG